MSVMIDSPRRQRRIAELLHKAIVEAESTLPSPEHEASTAADAADPVAIQTDLSDSERVLRFLRVTVLLTSASPPGCGAGFFFFFFLTTFFFTSSPSASICCF